MKKIYVIPIFILITIFAFAELLEKDGKAARTGAPGEFDCTGCHTSFPVNTGGGSITISSPNLTNWQYVPGQVYQIDVTVAKTGVPLFGFGFEALRTSNNTNGGALSITNAVETQIKSAVISGSSRTNVVHKEDGGLTANSHTFSFNWTAPSTNIGNIRFYTAGNATNNNNDSLGDYVYKTNQLVTPFVVGLEEVSSDEAISVFPNPASEEFTVSGLQFSDGDVAEILSSKGELVSSVSMTQSSTPDAAGLKMQTANLSNGIYFLKLSSATGNKQFIKKVLIHH